ncbi:DbpA RNA binding domain-containing protein, partial [Novosphingobium sp.]|uniref:DbpA RNA binding domain-containing protein n=1 Tax=Novosphingobium sp. TaxID=1874826 RepID=UPI0028ADF122
IGRQQNADPRWILPLLCRRGHVTRNAVGQIRIMANQTYFQIPRAQADQFVRAVERTANEDSGDVENTIRIEQAQDTPREVGRERRREGPQGRGRKPHGGREDGPRGSYQPRPTGGARPERSGGGKPFHKKPKKGNW